VVAGSAGVIALAAVVHLLGCASPPVEVGYTYTNFLSTSLNLVSFAVYVLLSAALGCAFRQWWAVGVGMMLPWPVACAIEIAHDPTSHNLFPFEAIFFWLPALVVSLMGAWVGRTFVSRRSKSDLLDLRTPGES
jgi:hypothetical protein